MHALPSNAPRILQYPDPRLTRRTEELPPPDNLEEIVRQMKTSMYMANGVGLAAPQIGFHLRMFILDDSVSLDHQVFVNPHIKPLRAKKVTKLEGCLSFEDRNNPGTYFQVRVARYPKILVDAQGLDGEPFSFEADDLLARAIQHELDHLNGRLMIDRITHRQATKLKRNMGLNA